MHGMCKDLLTNISCLKPILQKNLNKYKFAVTRTHIMHRQCMRMALTSYSWEVACLHNNKLKLLTLGNY